MATITVEAHKILKPNEMTAFKAPTAFAASDTVKIPMAGRTVIVRVTTTTAGNLVFSKGDGFQAVGSSLTVAGTATQEACIQLDSGVFENTSGTNKGFAIMTPAVAGTITVTEAL